MSTEEKMILVGIGFVIGSVIGYFTYRYRLVPEHRLKRTLVIAAVALLVGAGLIIAGILKGKG